jgi:hypothetical protein
MVQRAKSGISRRGAEAEGLPTRIKMPEVADDAKQDAFFVARHTATANDTAALLYRLLTPAGIEG